MEFKFDETTLWEFKENPNRESNSYLILAKADEVKESEIQKVIGIIDETGEEVNCTYDKFVEIFDEQGLAGFII